MTCPHPKLRRFSTIKQAYQVLAGLKEKGIRHLAPKRCEHHYHLMPRPPRR